MTSLLSKQYLFNFMLYTINFKIMKELKGTKTEKNLLEAFCGRISGT